MKANRWSLINAAGPGNSGHEELQTDVMSFMAILGFCLMAIFAIVQSIPMEPSDNRPELETVGTLQNDLKELTQQLQNLRSDVSEEEQKIDQLLQLQQSLSSQLNQSFEAGIQQLQQAKSQLIDVQQRTDKQQNRLAVINNDIWQGEQTLSRLRKRIKLETRILHEQEAELEAIKAQRNLLATPKAIPQQLPQPQEAKQPEQSVVDEKQLAEESQQVPEKTVNSGFKPDKPPATSNKLQQASKVKPPQKDAQQSSQSVEKQDQERGFNLRFKSDKALIHLLEKQRIQLFAMTAHNTWQLSTDNGYYRLNDSHKPRLFYEMTLATVPAELVRQVRLQRSVYNAKDLTWGVVLPQLVRSQISQLMNRYSSGVLVITDQAQVLREES